MYIESASNPRVKTWSQLKTKKGRQTTGLFLVEGIRLVAEGIASGLRVEAVLWDVGTAELPADIVTALQASRVPVVELSPTAFAAVADTVTPQGVIAVVKRPDGRLAAALQGRAAALALALDGVQDPGNLGTLLRSADAFGASLVGCGSGTVDPFSPKVVRASMGGLFRVRVSTEATGSFVQRWKSENGLGQVVSTAASSTTLCTEVNFCKPTLLLIGSEANGISDAVAALADVTVRIPMELQAESLNAAMAGSILLYEAYRQRLLETR